MENLIILFIALILDLALGEPPKSIHLTVWMGKVIDFFSKFGLALRRPSWQFIYGVLLTIFLIAIFGGASYALLSYLSGFNSVLYFIFAVLILKSTFCLRESWKLSLMVRDYLNTGSQDLSEAPEEIQYLLTTVEHNEGDEREPPIVSSTVRSLAENASDFLVAPIVFYLILGVPGAVAYRVANILDGMIGHHGEYEHLGKFAARLDDVINFIPARLTALLLVLAAVFTRQDAGKAWRVALNDHTETESLNAGWPMAAAAGALGVQLERVGHYALGRSEKPLTAETITQAVRLYQVMALLLSITCLSIVFVVT